MLRNLTVACSFLALGACSGLATPTVETELLKAGVGTKMAACMAKRMTDRLSIPQLQKLSRLRGAPGEKITDLSPSEVIGRVNRIGDPEVVAVVTSSAAACALTA